MKQERQTKLRMSLENWREVEIETKAQMHAAFCKMTLAKVLYEEAIMQIKARGAKTNEEREREQRRRYAEASRKYATINI